jgi:hypothetical protein
MPTPDDELVAAAVSTITATVFSRDWALVRETPFEVVLTKASKVMLDGRRCCIKA